MDSNSLALDHSQCGESVRVRFVEAGHSELGMETVSEVQTFFELQSEGRLVQSNEESEGGSMKRPSILGWYRILRVHYHWPLFQAVRFALWLAR